MPKQTRSATNYLAPTKTSEVLYEAEPIEELGHREISNHVPYSDSTFTEVYKQEVYAESYTENPSTEAHSKSYKVLSDGNSQETEISDAFAWTMRILPHRKEGMQRHSLMKLAKRRLRVPRQLLKNQANLIPQL